MIKRKKRNGGGKIAALIIAPLLIIVLCFVAIIEGILGIIMKIIETLLDFLSDPLGWFSELFRDVGNAFARVFDGDYTPPEPKNSYMTVDISEDVIAQVKDELEGIAVDPEKSGLTDTVVRKMTLTYFRTLATTDTIIYTPIAEKTDNGIIINETEYTWKELLDGKLGEENLADVGKINPSKCNDIKAVGDAMDRAASDLYIYFYSTDDSEDSAFDTGKLYMGTKGTVTIYNQKNEKFKYYDEETMQTILEDYSGAAKKKDENSNYMQSFNDVFDNIYTMNNAAIGGICVGKTAEAGEVCFEVYDYKDEVSKYCMPIELQVNMLSIVASPDFIDTVANLVKNAKIEIQLSQNTFITETTKTETITFNNLSDITGKYVDDEGLQQDKSIKQIGVPPNYSRSFTNTEIEGSSNYTFAIRDVNCWYCKVHRDIQSQISTYYLGENDEVLDDVTDHKVDISDEVEASATRMTNVTVLQLGASKNLFEKGIASAISNDLFRTYTEIVPTYSGFSVNATKETKVTERVYILTTETFEDNTDVFVELLRAKYPDLYKTNRDAVPGDLLLNAAEEFFDLLAESTNTIDYVNIMKYILYKYSDGASNFGITNFEDAFSMLHQTEDAFSVESLREYLHQFAGTDVSATQSGDKQFYEMYVNSSGCPSIGPIGLKYEEFNSYFNAKGQVYENGQVSEKENVAEYINEKIGGVNTKKTETEMANLKILIEKDFVDGISDQIAQLMYKKTEMETSGLKLCKQQLYALTEIMFSKGNIKQGEGFVKVYKQALEKYDENSPEMNMYIWDNYWYKALNTTTTGDHPEYVQKQDALFETYVKGTYEFDPPVKSRNKMTFYKKEQLSELNVSFPTDRTASKEKEIFTFEEKGGTLVDTAKTVHDYLSDPSHLYYYCLGGTEQSRSTHNNAGLKSCGLNPSFEDSKKPGSRGYRLTCCATYVSWVLQESGVVDSFLGHSSGFWRTLRDLGWTEVKFTGMSSLQAGDIVFMDTVKPINGQSNDHVQIYIGDNCWYNTGSNGSIHAREPESYSIGANQVYKVYRQP